MNQAATPDVANFSVLSNGVPLPVASFVWVDAFFFDITVIGTWTGALGEVLYHTMDPNFRSLDGVIVTAPQTQQFFP